MILSPLDYFLISAFIGLGFLIGLRKSRVHQNENFLISDRSLGAFSSGMTIAASKIGAGAIILYSSLVFQFGYGALWLFVGYIFGYLIFYLFARNIREQSRRYGYYTLPDYFQKHFDHKVSLIIGILCAISLSGWIITNFIAGGKMISYVTGLPFYAGIIIIISIIVPYLLRGGFDAVVRTDAIQYLALITLGILIALALTKKMPTLEEINLTQMGLGKIISFFVTGLFFPMGSAELWQRVYATKNDKELKKALTIASATFIIIGTALSVICLRLRSVLNLETIDVDIGLISGISTVLGPGFAGLWIVAFLSAIISSSDTFVFTSANSWIQDVGENIKKTNPKYRINNIRKAIIFLSITGLLLSIYLENVISVTFLFAGITMMIGVISIITWQIKNINASAIYWGAIIGLISIVLQASIQGISVITAVTGLVCCLICSYLIHFFKKRKPQITTI